MTAAPTPEDGDRRPKPLPPEVRRSLIRIKNRTGDENDLKRVVMRYARDHGWTRFHPTPARRRPGDGGFITTFEGEPGFLDCTFLRGGRLVVAELKAERGEESTAQQEWARLWREVAVGAGMADGRARIEVHCWRPRDWEQIKRCLF